MIQFMKERRVARLGINEFLIANSYCPCVPLSGSLYLSAINVSVMVYLEPLFLGLMEIIIRNEDSGLCEHLIAITSLRNLNEEKKLEFTLGGFNVGE